MIQETVKIAISRVGEPVAIMDLIVVGRGSILPVGAVWVDEAGGWWRREPTDDVIRTQIERGAGYLGKVTGYERIEASAVPVDRTFRDAWEYRSGQIEVDMPGARKIHLERVRVARAEVLAGLDREWMKATGQGKKTDADAVEAKRQRLRDLPATLGVETAATPEELAALWDPELGPR